MKAQDVIEQIKGLNEPASEVKETDLPTLLCQEGTGCDCRGCDKD